MAGVNSALKKTEPGRTGISWELKGIVGPEENLRDLYSTYKD